MTEQNEMRRGVEDKGGLLIEKIQLLQFSLEVGFLLRLPALRDFVAERTRMFAVESFFQRFRERSDTGVVRQHRDPSHRLQRRPMRARRAQQRDNQQQMTGTIEHACFIMQAPIIVKQSNLEIVAQLTFRWCGRPRELARL